MTMISDCKGYKYNVTVFCVKELEAKGCPQAITCNGTVPKYDSTWWTVNAENEPLFSAEPLLLIFIELVLQSFLSCQGSKNALFVVFFLS